MASERNRFNEVVSYILAVFAFGANLTSILLGTVNGAGNGGGIFRNQSGSTSDKYFTEITPESYVFGTIWPIIFFWTLLGSLYFVVSICLPLAQSPLKRNPSLAPNAYLMLYGFGYGCTCAWYFAFDFESLGWSLALLALCSASVIGAIGVSLYRLSNNTLELEVKNKVMLWLVRVLVQNGLCILGTWVTIATSLGMLFVILYRDSPGSPIAIQRGLISVEDGSSIVLGLLMGVIILYFILENFVWEKYLRYMFTIYPVFIFAFSGVIVKLIKLKAERNLIIASVAIGIASVALLLRIALSVYRYITRTNDIVETKSKHILMT